MAEQHFDAFTNEYDSTLPPATPETTPDEPTIYHHTLTDQLANDAITAEEFEPDMAELERLGYVKRIPGETEVYPLRAERWMHTDRPVRNVPVDSLVNGFTKGIEDRLLDAVNQLGAATVAYGEALDLHSAAVVDAYESQATLDYAELDYRAKLLAHGVPGSNEPTRKINLDLAVMDDEALGELRIDADKCRHAKTQAETSLRKCDQAQKSIHAQISALTALLQH